MKMSSTGSLILSIIWIVVALLWLLRMDNPVTGLAWLCAGIVELIIAIITRRSEYRNVSEMKPAGTTESAAFSILEKTDYYKQRWLKEHRTMILLLGFLILVWFIAGFLLKQPLMMSVTPGLVALAHAWRNNSMMAYVEDHIYTESNTSD